ncbi:MAG TPA: RNA-binding protein [Fusibacter sp.]|nr:RNA-binding protein [Fusibacter sp.]
MMTSSQELQIGQFVKSKAGRDKGNVLIVFGIVDEQYVLVVDGDLRKLEKPKKKKVKHLSKIGDVDMEIQNVMTADKPFNNAWLRKKVADRLDQVRVRRDDSNG